VIVTNNTFRLCPWADVLYGFDSRWWRQYPDASGFKGEKLSASQIAENYGAKWQPVGGGNSGAAAIALAMGRGASSIVLLAYDAMFDNGRKHWHADHQGLENAHTISEWPRQFAMIARAAKRQGATILNASRRTALTCFPLTPLEDALQVEFA
jgi:hypothetical protein